MKKIISSLFICTVILSCKKDHTKDVKPTDATHKVAFKVGFTQQTTDIDAAGKLKVSSTDRTINSIPLDSIADVMYFAVYDSLGNKIHINKQISADSNFGSFTDNLHSGIYTIIIAAGKDGLQLNNDVNVDKNGYFAEIQTSNLKTDVLTYGGYSSDDQGINQFKDTFYKKIQITVSNDDSSQDVNLDRITSQVKVNIEDAIPANAKLLALTIKSAAVKYYIDAGKAVAIGKLVTAFYDVLKTTDIATINHSFKSSVFLAAPTSTDVLYCSSSATISSTINGDIAKLTINNVGSLPNKVTLLTGKLFGGAGTSSAGGQPFNVDTAYSSITINKSF